MMDIYARQEELQLTLPQAITVVGCGGIGAWVAILSAMSGVENIYIFDPDVVEESNRNRLPFCQGSLNRPKVEVVADFIKAIRPDAIVVAVAEKLEGVLIPIQLSVSKVIIECTDSPKSQLTLYKACKEKGELFIRAGYDGTRILVTSDVTGWMKDDVEEEPYTVNPSWVVPAVVVAALAVAKMEKFFSQEVGLDISEIGIPALARHRRLTARCRQERR